MSKQSLFSGIKSLHPRIQDNETENCDYGRLSATRGGEKNWVGAGKQVKLYKRTRTHADNPTFLCCSFFRGYFPTICQTACETQWSPAHSLSTEAWHKLQFYPPTTVSDKTLTLKKHTLNKQKSERQPERRQHKVIPACWNRQMSRFGGGICLSQPSRSNMLSRLIDVWIAVSSLSHCPVCCTTWYVARREIRLIQQVVSLLKLHMGLIFFLSFFVISPRTGTSVSH